MGRVLKDDETKCRDSYLKIFLLLLYFITFLTTACFAENYYAITSHKSKNNNHLVTVTKIPDLDTCKKVLALKGGPNPMGDNKWETVEAICQDDSLAYMLEPSINRQPILEPYAWFRDRDGFPTVVKVMGFEPGFAKIMVNILAIKIRSWGFEVEVVNPKNKK